MQALRRARLLTFLVVALLWSSLGMSALAPVWASMSPERWGAICATTPDRVGGARSVSTDTFDNGGQASDDAGLLASLHTLDCALCLPFAAPPGAPQSHLPEIAASDAQPRSVEVLAPHTALAWRWSARGPPRSV